MSQAILLVLLSVIHTVNDIYAVIFPLFPQIGLVIGALGLLFLVVYALKSGLGQAIKFSIGLVLLLTIAAYFVGKILKLFSGFGSH